MIYLMVLSYVVAAVYAEEKYTNKYDGLNVMEILENKRMVANIADCLRDKIPCSPEAKELKEHLEEALKNECDKCTDMQKTKIPEVIIYLIKYEPELWAEAVRRYDPTGEYRKKYEALAKERGYTINVTSSVL